MSGDGGIPLRRAIQDLDPQHGLPLQLLVLLRRDFPVVAEPGKLGDLIGSRVAFDPPPPLLGPLDER